ncbi:hypothetical protein BRD13_04715 [Halobacteriales archaeon SW_5_70_135]|nr:MAG: hypothetical protein BRD13_04715 [Halobacteriales archaeon SW_5_70_135]
MYDRRPLSAPRTIDRLRHCALFVPYQATLAVGIALLSLAVGLDCVGITLPTHRVVAVGEALDDARRAAR